MNSNDKIRWIRSGETALGIEMCIRDRVCPDGEIVMAQDAGFANEGVIAGENFLQAMPDIQGVMGINYGGVLGVYEAFKAAGKSFEKDGIALVGCDASVDGLAAMKEGDMFYCTIDLDLVNQVSQMYEMCLRDRLKADVSTLTTDVAELKADVAGLKEDVSGLKEDVSGLKRCV